MTTAPATTALPSWMGPLRRSRLLRYVTSFALLIGLYTGYRLAVVPFIEPEGPSAHRGPGYEGPFVVTDALFRQRFSTLFPEGAWELSNSKLVQLDQAFVLAEDYKPQDDGRLLITPCTVIFYPNSDGNPEDARPIVMQAPEGALLEFDQPFDFTTFHGGKVVGGLLKGDIAIWSPETTPGANDQLQINTHNIQINSQRVWTPHDVDFRYGESYGSGRDLVIMLDDTSGGAKTGNSPMAGIRSLELVHVDQVYIVPPPKETPAPAEGEPVAAAHEAEPSVPIQITCQGSFLLDLEDQVASFNDQVDLHRLNFDGPSDQLQCEQLALHFRQGPPPPDDSATAPTAEPAAETAAATSTQPADDETDNRLQIAKIVARGTPVIGRGPSFDAEFRGELLEYDFDRRLVDLTGQGGVTLRYEQNTIEAPRVQYQLAAEGGKLGRAWASGPGHVISLDGETGETKLAASWQDNLRLRPHEGMHVLSLYEHARVGLGPSGGITANEIHVWLREEAESETPPLAGDAAPEQLGGIVPDRMMAQGEVHIESRQLLATTNRVELWLEDHRTPAAEAGGNGGLVPIDPGQPAATSTPLVGQPAGDEPPRDRLEVTGNLLRALLVRAGQDDWIVENLTLEENVRLTQRSLVNPQDIPLRVAGNFLQMRGVSQTGGTVSVQGMPAMVFARDVTTRGANIQLDREQNRLWIDGPGQVDLPLSNDLLSRATAAPQSSPAAAPSPNAAVEQAHVTWQGGLNFDGQTFRFDRDVVVTGRDQQATCQKLEVVLDQPVDFAHPETDGKTAARQVALSGNVEIAGRTIENGLQTSTDYMQLERISLDPITGRIAGTGPGVLRSTRRGAALSPLGGASPPTDQEQDGLTYFEVTFNQGLSGNSIEKQIEFFDRVVTVYGPVDDWNQRLTSQNAGGVPEQVVVLTCQRLRVAEVGRTAVSSGWRELEASGNTLVEGYNFTARGNRIGYTEEKDLLTMEGDGRSSVQLWRRTANGQESSLAARKILFFRRTNDFQVQDVTSLDLTNLGVRPPNR